MSTDFKWRHYRGEVILWAKAISTLFKERGLLLDGARLAAALSADKNDLTLKDIAELADIF